MSLPDQSPSVSVLSQAPEGASGSSAKCDDVVESRSALSLDVAVSALQDDGLLSSSDSFYPLVIDLPQEATGEAIEALEEHVRKRV
jgi:hypothetical protein